MKNLLTGLLIITSFCCNAQSWVIPDYTNLYKPKPIIYPTVINHNHYHQHSDQFSTNGRNLLIGDIIDGLISTIVSISKNNKRKRINKTRRTRKLRSININHSYTYSR